MSEEAEQKYEVILEPCRKPAMETAKLVSDGRAVYIHSKYDPLSEAEKMTAPLFVGVDTCYVVFGLGLGYHIRALLGRMGTENRILVFEPNQEVLDIFIKSEKNKDICGDKRVVIAKYISAEKTRVILRPYFLTPFAHTKNRLFLFPIYRDLYINECKAFADAIKSQIYLSFLSKNTTSIFADIWFDCLVNNYRFIRESYSSRILKGLFKDVPAVIISAGPSLSKNIGLLKELYGKALLISVDTAFNTIYDTIGIVPNFVVTIDAQPMVIYKFSSEKILESDLITTYMGAKEVLRQHRGRKIAIREFHVYLDECYKDLGIELIEVESGGSVACTALDMAHKMGANPIILMGQDLANTGNKSHVSGTAFYTETAENAVDSLTVTDVFGNPVQTTITLNSYKEWFEMFISMNDDITYIDATEGGARIQGTTVMPLREAMDKYCTNTLDIEGIKKIIYSEDNKTATKEQFDGFINHFARSSAYLKKTLPEIEACALTCEKITKEIERNGFTRPERIVTPYDRIRKLTKNLDKNVHHVDIVLALVGNARDQLTSTDYLDEESLSEEQKLAYSIENYCDYFKVLAEKIKYALPLIDSAVLEAKKNMEG